MKNCDDKRESGYVIAALSFLAFDPSQSATVDLAAGQEAYLKLVALGWPNSGARIWC
jgi:hypothetical protein